MPAIAFLARVADITDPEENAAASDTNLLLYLRKHPNVLVTLTIWLKGLFIQMLSNLLTPTLIPKLVSG